MTTRTPSQRRRVRLKIEKTRNQRKFLRMRDAGFTMVMAWIPRRWFDSVGVEATRLNVHRQTILRAAIEVGLRHLTPSDILRTEQTWKSVLHLPVETRYVGDKFDDKHRFKKREPACQNA